MTINPRATGLIAGIVLLALCGCRNAEIQPLVKAGGLRVSDNHRYLVTPVGEPFFWIGGTTWGMPEWLTREEVDHYLDHRKGIGFNVVQLCLFWGKRVDDPKNFFVNPPDAYGYRAFHEIDGKPDTGRPLVLEGGTPANPNDYWDHVDYIMQAARKHDMQVAVLPVWGRRYVNASHEGFSSQVFSVDTMYSYGEFLGERYGHYDNLIWVLGGDVQADARGDYPGWYRTMAEGLLKGVTGEKVAWNEDSPLWDRLLMTYHPDGQPMKNSSTWFHRDPWLDFNMIETWAHRDSIISAVQWDYNLKDPIKPTVLGEPSYENYNGGERITTALEMRREAYHAFFAGAAGFTYGAYRDQDGNGPLYSPFKGWQEILDFEGAHDMQHVRTVCLDNGWPGWEPVDDVLVENAGEGELKKVSVMTTSGDYLVYFPDTSGAVIQLPESTHAVPARWFRPADGYYSETLGLNPENGFLEVSPPESWEDAVLILSATRNQE